MQSLAIFPDRKYFDIVTWQYLHTSLQKNLQKLQMQTIPHCMRSLPLGVPTVIDIGRFTHCIWKIYPPETINVVCPLKKGGVYPLDKGGYHYIKGFYLLETRGFANFK